MDGPFNPLQSRLCGCVTDALIEDLPRLLRYPGVDLLEWRLDLLIRQHALEPTLNALHLLSDSSRLPVLVTNRPPYEGGAFEGSEALRIDTLKQAVQAGADWVDLENNISDDTLSEFQSMPARVVLSHHELEATPGRSALRRLVERMAQRSATIVKIAAYAQTPEDNLKVLDLIPFGQREFGVEVIAFCMGPLGRWSRMASLLIGSPWTYVQLPGHASAAPGQLDADTLRMALALMESPA